MRFDINTIITVVYVADSRELSPLGYGVCNRIRLRVSY